MMLNLKVNRNEFAQALKTLDKFIKPNKSGEAIFFFENNKLNIQLGGVRTQASAEGTWSGQARVPNSRLIHLWKGLPEDDPLIVRVEGGYIYIGGFAISCVWQGSEGKLIELPLDPPFSLVLSLPLKYSEDDISRSGLANVVLRAEKHRDSLVAQCVKLLSPLEVTTADIRRMIDESLRRKYEILRKNSSNSP